MVFHPAARRTRVGPGGQRWPLWRCEKNQPQFIQRRYNRAQRHTHLPAQHIWHSGQVRCKRMICLTRTNTMTVITTSSVVSSDSGEYFCSVTPWYLSASTGAWTEAQELTSSKVFLAVKFAGVVQKTHSYTFKHKSLRYMCIILLYVTPILLFPLSVCSLGLPKVASLIWCIGLTG